MIVANRIMIVAIGITIISLIITSIEVMAMILKHGLTDVSAKEATWFIIEHSDKVFSFVLTAIGIKFLKYYIPIYLVLFIFNI